MTTFGQQQISNLTPSKIKSRVRALKDIRYSAALFNTLLTEDLNEREKASNNITQTIKAWAKECYPSEKAEASAQDGEENVSGVSSPLNNKLMSPLLSSVSPFNSPFFNDESGPASYASSPTTDNKSTSIHVFPDEVTDGMSDEERRDYFQLVVLQMLRLSIDCPFSGVRFSFNKCLNKLRATGVPVPAPISNYPSFYIASEDILTLEWPSGYADNFAQHTPHSMTPTGYSSPCSLSSSNSSSYSEETPRIIRQPLTPTTPLCLASPSNFSVGKQPDDSVKRLMTETFIKLGRISHYYRVLAYFPKFMEKYQDSYNNIIRSPSGAVPLNWRLYIGIMAGSQYKCQYVVSKLIDDFLRIGGNTDWLQGLQHKNVPAKIRNLARLNTILAHQPWSLNTSHIEALVRGSSNQTDNWKVSEVVHVIVILSTFHSLSRYALGCGIAPEYDSIGGSRDEESGGSIGILDSFESFSSDIASGLGVTLEEQSSTAHAYDPPPPEDFSRFLDPLVEIQYADFDKNIYEQFKLQDYCWETHGVAMVDDYLPEIGEMLNREFDEVIEFSDYSLFQSHDNDNPSSVDRDKRQAVWFYILILSGIKKEDYNYSELNKLDNKIKAFIKKVCTKPEDFGYNDWNLEGFREEEKCHMNLVAVEARKQVELVYGLSCVMDWMS